jgi:hypothetical protein
LPVGQIGVCRPAGEARLPHLFRFHHERENAEEIIRQIYRVMVAARDPAPKALKEREL